MIELLCGDCLELTRGLPDASVDAVVTDPPAGIGFMGQSWDRDRGCRREWIAWLSSVLAECLRVARPGSVLLCWALPRTSHWTGTAIEDAGWRIEDRIAHHFGSGFPKHRSKLKPATEDWWLARKPGGSKWLNIDGCRVAAPEGLTSGGQRPPKVRLTCAQDSWTRDWDKPRSREHPAGRWPANLAMSHSTGCDGTCADDCPIRLMGGTARFFYCAKASRKDRNSGCEGMPRRSVAERDGRNHCINGSKLNGSGEPVNGDGKDSPSANHHPTVKPEGLMRWLCRLATPPGGTILDPFMGSGSTGKAAVLEGFSFIGIEREPEYFRIAEARIAAASAA